MNLRIFKCQIDAIDLAKKTVKYPKLKAPDNCKIATSCEYCIKKELENAHNAANDMLATVQILTFTQFWNRRKEHMKCMNAVQGNDRNDSYADDESNSDDSIEAGFDSDE